MLVSLHKQATTTPKIRAAIQASADPAWMVAERYGISEQTVWKWRKGACHVWTAPFVQGLIWVNVDRRRLRSCVRPVYAVRLTAGPDEVRLPGPNQNNELESPDSTSGYPGSGPV